MGTVWAARHELLGRDFALKFARVPTTTDPALRARFQHEAQLVGKLRHPNIVDVTDFGEIAPDGDFFLAMELLEGESLADRIAKHGPLDSYEAVTIAADVAKGLSAVHAIGIVHRDVKPENIFLARSATGSIVPKLLDFGISKEWSDTLATPNGALTGTPAYMSPEQANGETALDPRTDIWSLGVVLYEMLTGKHPFVESNYQALMRAIAEAPHVPLAGGVPQRIRHVVECCLSKRPEDRYQTGKALADALLATVDHEAARARPSSRTRRVLPIAALSLSLLAVIVAGAMWLTRQPPPSSGDIEAAAKPTTSTTSATKPLESTSSAPDRTSPPATSSTTPTSPFSRPSATTRPQTSAHGKRVPTSVDSPGF